MKVRNHLAHARHATRHVAEQVVLIPAVNADIGVSVPDQDRVNAPVTFLEVVQIAVYGVLPCRGIIKVAVLDHHLRLDKGLLSPLEFRAIVLLAAVPGANQPLATIVLQVRQPRLPG